MPKHVLIVEGNRSERLLYRSLLEDHGFSVFEADSGEHALKLAKGSVLDCLVIGDSLPGIKGLDLVSAIRHSGNKSGIVLAVEDSQVEDTECLSEGMDVWAVLPKKRISELPKKAFDASEYANSEDHKKLLLQTISESMQMLKEEVLS